MRTPTLGARWPMCCMWTAPQAPACHTQVGSGCSCTLEAVAARCSPLAAANATPWGGTNRPPPLAYAAAICHCIALPVPACRAHLPAETPADYHTNDTQTARDMNTFLRRWFAKYEQFQVGGLHVRVWEGCGWDCGPRGQLGRLGMHCCCAPRRLFDCAVLPLLVSQANDFFIAGESFGGVYVPLVSQVGGRRLGGCSQQSTAQAHACGPLLPPALGSAPANPRASPPFRLSSRRCWTATTRGRLPVCPCVATWWATA